MKFDREKLQKLAKKFKLALIILFGSQTTGSIHKESDTDIAVKTNKKITEKEYNKLADELGKIFTNLDLINLENAPPLLLARVAEQGKVLFEDKKSGFAEFQIRAINEYIDYNRWFDLREKLNKQKICRQ